jgi:cellobiose-specific phosphotransferase system component IIA
MTGSELVLVVFANDLAGKVGAAKDALETATKAGKTSEIDQARSDLEKASTNLSKHRKDEGE